MNFGDSFFLRLSLIEPLFRCLFYDQQPIIHPNKKRKYSFKTLYLLTRKLKRTIFSPVPPASACEESRFYCYQDPFRFSHLLLYNRSIFIFRENTNQNQ